MPRGKGSIDPVVEAWMSEVKAIDDVYLKNETEWREDTIFGRLDFNFTFEQAMQQSAIIKGAGVTYNSVYQMLKNWRKQGLIKKAPPATSPRWKSFRLEVRG